MNISLRDILEGQQKINQNNNNNNLFQKKATNEMGSLKIVNNTIDFPSLDLKKKSKNSRIILLLLVHIMKMDWLHNGPSRTFII